MKLMSVILVGVTTSTQRGTVRKARAAANAVLNSLHLTATVAVLATLVILNVDLVNVTSMGPGVFTVNLVVGSAPANPIMLGGSATSVMMVTTSSLNVCPVTAASKVLCPMFVMLRQVSVHVRATTAGAHVTSVAMAITTILSVCTVTVM